ncbi:T6SS immunity protein Tli4 family protein [Cronobacter dublinensis]|nr:hypothetical protein [Cronobacter dublinensis]
MKKYLLFLLLVGRVLSSDAMSMTWRTECVGYYQLQLPDNIEVALYPINDFVKPNKEPKTENGILIKKYSEPRITFGKNNYWQDNDAIQAQFTAFYYSNYMIGISSEADSYIDFSGYLEKVKADFSFVKESSRELEKSNLKLYHEAMTPEEKFKRKYDYLIKTYPDSFAAYIPGARVVYINKNRQLYLFWGEYQKDTGEKSETAEKQWQQSEPEVLSLLSRFRPRNLYEVPSSQGFCLPYGFITNDSGHESRNMGVTYRLKNHPDVTIFFQDLGPSSGPGERRPDPNMSAKDYVTYFWNVRYGHSFRDIKLYGKGFSYPDMDNRKAVAASAKFTRYDKQIDYGYVAFVKGETPEEPDLLFYVIRDSRQARGNPPVAQGEIEKMAEHIVSTIKRR